MKSLVHPILTLLVLSVFTLSGRAEETLLIDSERGNGGFESGDMTGWLDVKDPLSAPQKVVKAPRNGDYVYKVKVMGKPGERASSLLFQNVTNVDPGAGRNFALKFDTKSMPDKSAPSIAAEFVIFNGDEVTQTVTFDMEATDSSEWVSHEAISTSGVNGDWAGGKLQLRIIFYKDGGQENESYEILVDNVKLIQKP